MSPRIFSTVAALACGLLAARVAVADDEAPVPKPRATPPDTRAFHPTVALGLNYGHLLGSFESGAAQTTRASWGAVPSLEVALPLARSAAVALWGERGAFDGGTADCSRCRATSTAGGIAAVYHLVDGAPLDPWLTAGLGYRRTTLRLPTTTQPTAALASYDYSGIDALRIALGADYYFTRWLGVGPSVGFTVGRYTARSPGPFPTGVQSTNGSFTFGLRVVISPLSL